MVKQIQKRVRRQIKAKQSDNTIEALIERQEWPKGGLLELQNAIRSEMDWVYNSCFVKLKTCRVMNVSRVQCEGVPPG